MRVHLYMVLVVALLFGCIVFVGAAPKASGSFRQLGVIPVTIYLNGTEGGTITNNTQPAMQVYIRDELPGTEYALVSSQIVPGGGTFSSRAAAAAGKPKGHDTRQPTFDPQSKKSKKEKLDRIEGEDGDLLVVTAVGFEGNTFDRPVHKTQVWTIKN
jgi:hypothetical protein